MQDSNAENKEKRSNKMLRWVEIFAFLILFAAILKVLSFAVDPVRSKQPEVVLPRDKNIIASLIEEPDSMDVLIVGDSEAMVMVSPQILMDEAGISAYNCNQLGQRVADTYFYLQKILEKQHPKVIILETNVITHETSIKTEALMTNSAIMNEVFPILRYHSNWRYLSGLVEPEPYTHYKGYEDILVVDPYSGEDYMFETDERAVINPITIYYLNKVCELCKEKGVPLVFVSSPSPINMDYPRHNALQDYADKQGIDYIDFDLLTEEIGIDWSQDTGDKGDHINSYGGEKTTRYLMNYLKENYDLPDHRED